MDGRSKAARADDSGHGRRTPSSGLRISERMSYQTTLGSQSFAAKYSKKPKRASSKVSGLSTFYREPTPPSSSHGGSLSANDDYYDYSYDRVAPPAPIPKTSTYGIRRRTVYIIVGVIAAAIILGIGLGVGLGVGLRKETNVPTGSADSDTLGTKDISEATSAPSSSLSATPTSTSSNPATTSAISCPSANNTRYRVPDTDKIFLRICGIDYSGAGNAVDLASVWTTSMQDCMFQCVDFPGCTACGWGVIPSDPGSEHRCWLKGNLTSSHVARPGWDFAILEG